MRWERLRFPPWNPAIQRGEKLEQGHIMRAAGWPRIGPIW